MSDLTHPGPPDVPGQEQCSVCGGFLGDDAYGHHSRMCRCEHDTPTDGGSTDTRETETLRERDGWMRHAQTSDREVRDLRLTLGTIYATWATRDCQHDPQAECVDDPDRDEADMCDRCWLVDLIRKSIPEPGLTNTLVLMERYALVSEPVAEETLRSCPECAREDEHLMEDGSWICHSCGHVDFPNAAQRDQRPDNPDDDGA